MKYAVLLALIIISSCSDIEKGSESKDGTVAPTIQVESVNKGEGESFNSF